MIIDDSYPYKIHPCWSEDRRKIVARIHLPVAPRCNLRCSFCDPSINTSSHIPKPGSARRVMSPQEALAALKRELRKRDNLRIVGISGPGEPLYNSETFTTLSQARNLFDDIDICLSTNGTLLSSVVDSLDELQVRTVSVSMSAISPEAAQEIYRWANIDGKILKGPEMAEVIIDRQLAGIKRASKRGIAVKVNSILIPGVNDNEMSQISQTIVKYGAKLQNIVPLVPFAKMSHIPPPSPELLASIRKTSSVYIPQFQHCKQCRSDVVGIPGEDCIL